MPVSLHIEATVSQSVVQLLAKATGLQEAAGGAAQIRLRPAAFPATHARVSAHASQGHYLAAGRWPAKNVSQHDQQIHGWRLKRRQFSAAARYIKQTAVKVMICVTERVAEHETRLKRRKSPCLSLPHLAPRPHMPLLHTAGPSIAWPYSTV